MAVSPTARGRLGGLTRSSLYDGLVVTSKARAAADARFLAQVDPSGELRRANPKEAARRAEAARKLHYVRMAYESARSRSRNKKTANGSGSSAVLEAGDGSRQPAPPV